MTIKFCCRNFATDIHDGILFFEYIEPEYEPRFILDRGIYVNGVVEYCHYCGKKIEISVEGIDKQKEE